MSKLTLEFLKQRQEMPLELKIKMSQEKIRQFYNYFLGEVYISFSGGKDSTVLLNLIREIYPNVPAVFVDTGLEYPEIREFVKTIDNVIWLKPSINFKEVIKKYGYPVISKNIAYYIEEIRNLIKNNKIQTATYKLRMEGIKQNGKKAHSKSILSKKWKYLINSDFKISAKCCDIIKKEPFKKYVKETKKKPFIGIMASEGGSRVYSYLQKGCNSFIKYKAQSTPIAFWKEKDIWDYIKLKKIKYSKIYDMGYKRTGCMFCMFGVHLEKEPNRFQLMKETHPNLWKYCMKTLKLKKILDYIKIKSEINKDQLIL